MPQNDHVVKKRDERASDPEGTTWLKWNDFPLGNQTGSLKGKEARHLGITFTTTIFRVFLPLYTYSYNDTLRVAWIAVRKKEGEFFPSRNEWGELQYPAPREEKPTLILWPKSWTSISIWLDRQESRDVRIQKDSVWRWLHPGTPVSVTSDAVSLPLRALCVLWLLLLTFYFILQLTHSAALFQAYSEVIQTIPIYVQTALYCDVWSCGFLELSPVSWLLIGCNDSQPWLNVSITWEVIKTNNHNTPPIN